MDGTVSVILRLSEVTLVLLEQQDLNLYEELQQELPSLQFRIEPDPDAPSGSRDAITVILAISTLVGSLSPIIIRILNQCTPPNRRVQWKTDETTETHHPDGSITTVHRIYVYADDEQRPWASLPYPKPSQPHMEQQPTFQKDQENDV
ncbi:hypothetical protein [Ktedonobacter robiniae]|uniref:Uncharacterized protein n=1 Tax=Ktedonobacter robiniae TaxID=2778365 RepID=A0ABQ3USZ2_9CHLR|nr:hypothetical protein [Ktedonobacter robiniae]GHO55918.1 hypothetical protein KSB_43930 [Ktedonobacter robiniae]